MEFLALKMKFPSLLFQTFCNSPWVIFQTGGHLYFKFMRTSLPSTHVADELQSFCDSQRQNNGMTNLLLSCWLGLACVIYGYQCEISCPRHIDMTIYRLNFSPLFWMTKEKSIFHNKDWFGEKPVLIQMKTMAMWLDACRDHFQLSEAEQSIDLVKTASLTTAIKILNRFSGGTISLISTHQISLESITNTADYYF